MKYSALFFIIISFFACSRHDDHFSSPDGKNNISIWTNGNIRYIANGIHNRIPDSGYVKINISKVDREVGDQVVGCWNKDGLEWVVLMDNVEIIENRLDKNKHMFLDNFPKDTTYNVPTLKGYNGVDCFSLSYSYGQIERIEGAIIRR